MNKPAEKPKDPKEPKPKANKPGAKVESNGPSVEAKAPEKAINAISDFAKHPKFDKFKAPKGQN